MSDSEIEFEVYCCNIGGSTDDWEEAEKVAWIQGHETATMQAQARINFETNKRNMVIKQASNLMEALGKTTYGGNWFEAVTKKMRAFVKEHKSCLES